MPIPAIKHDHVSTGPNPVENSARENFPYSELYNEENLYAELVYDVLDRENVENERALPEITEAIQGTYDDVGIGPTIPTVTEDENLSQKTEIYDNLADLKDN